MQTCTVELIEQYEVVDGLTPSTKTRIAIGVWFDHTDDDPIHYIEDAPDRVLYVDL